MRLTTCLAHLAFATLLMSPAYAQDPAASTDAQATAQAAEGEPVDATDADEASVPAETTEAAEPAVADASDAPETASAATEDATAVDAAAATRDDTAADVADTDAEAADGNEAAAAPAPATAASAIAIPAPPAGMGQVVFFREKKFAGSAVRFKVRENGEELGKLGSGIYFVHATQPGVHEYVVHSEAEDVLTLEVEDGETYYVQGSITMGLMVGRPNLSPTDEATFAAASAKLKPAKE